MKVFKWRGTKKPTQIKLMNLGCGFVRPGPPWVNVDRLNVGAGEPNFVQHELPNALPFPRSHFDGIFANHVMEHLDALQARLVMENCFSILKSRGLLCVGVPDASYHRRVWPEDTRKNSWRLFGEPIPDGDPVTNNLRRALFFHEHKQVFTEDSLWCHFVVAGFPAASVRRFDATAHQPDIRRGNFKTIANRLPFTLLMEGQKP